MVPKHKYSVWVTAQALDKFLMGLDFNFILKMFLCEGAEMLGAKKVEYPAERIL